MKYYRSSISCIAASLLIYGIAHAAILHVPGDYPTIQAALVFAENGDTVQVAPGTYYEHIVWPSVQGINLVSEYGTDSTIIDAVGSLSAITMEADVDSTTVINGFTIMNGGANYGGGIYCLGASPIINHNRITNNSSSVSGAALFCSNGSPVITQNVIVNNESGADGGAITIWDCFSAKIINNIIENNSGGAGGGISAVNSLPTISGNTVSGNSASHGGGLYFYKSVPLITYNTITNNNADYGGGLYFTESSGNVHNNDIFGNGYGLLMVDEGQINAENNWWGDASGPYHPTANPYGLGDTVSDYVDFEPWLTGPGVAEQPNEKPFSARMTACATILSGPLDLPEGQKCRVIDITGRVVDPTNIKQGIYYIEVDGQIVQKVIKVR